VTDNEKDLPVLPSNWKWITFGDIIDFLTDFQANGSFASLKQNVRTYSSKNYAVLVRLKDLRKQMKASTDFSYTDKHGYDFLKKSALRGGEILVANVGSVGFSIIMPNIDQPATLAPNMFLVLLSIFLELLQFNLILASNRKGCRRNQPAKNE
jgi:type I restriction enzyme, S subunit